MTTKLFKTLRDADIEELQELIAKGAPINEADKKGYTALIECASQGFAEGITALLAAGAKITAKDKKHGRTALTVATMDDQVDSVRALLHSPNVFEIINAQDEEGMTALHWALKLQHVEIASELITHTTIKLNLVAKDGYTPLMYAVQTGDGEMVMALLKSSSVKSNLNSSDKSGNTAFHLAALLDHPSIAEVLLPLAPTLLSAPNENGETPLHLAAADNNYEVVKWLIKQGADAKALTKDGLTPYQVSDPDSQSATALAAKTGEKPSIAPDSEEEIMPDEPEEEPEDYPEIEEKPDKSNVRKRVKPPPGAMTSKKAKNEESGNPLIARLLLVLVLGSSITYFLSLLF